jgi:hypothetical protein
MKKTEKPGRQGALKGQQTRPYNTPRLIDFGTVAQLTRQFGRSTRSDEGSNMMAPS